MTDNKTQYYNDLNKVDSKTLYNQLPEYTRIARYAQYNKNKKRRETWEEQTNRVFNMHKVKFAKYLDNEKFMEYFNFAKLHVLNKNVLGSQRALQFGGPSILNKNTRIYNCAATYIDRVKAFQEVMFTLLCGVGIGFSVQTHHISKLPTIKNTQDIQKIYQIPDSIEGWSDAIAILASSYFTDNQSFPEYFNYDISFDFSLIRPSGSNISNIGGKAPGPDGLKSALQKIKEVFINCISQGLDKLRPIDAYDIIVHSSDAVLSGGVRRCIGKGSLVLTRKESFKQIENIQKGDFVSTNDGWKEVTNTFVQGKQKTIKITHSNGELICTPNHRVAVLKNNSLELGDFEWKEAGNLKYSDKLLYVEPKIDETDKINILPEFPNIIIPPFDIEIAWLLGNIQCNKKGFYDYIRVYEKNNQEEQLNFIKKQLEKFDINYTNNQKLSTFFGLLLKNNVPKCVLQSTNDIKFAYIQGILDYNNNEYLKPEFLKDIQNILYSLGIVSHFKNNCIKDLIISSCHINKLNNGCSFGWNKIQNTNSYIENLFIPIYISVSIKSIEEYEKVETYDIEVEGNHNFICEGVLVHNSATLCLFSLEDTEMIGAKTGDWYIKNPQRARSNNSVLLLRDNTPEEKYMNLITSVKQFGEPGIIWSDNTETLYNPCVPSDTWVFTTEGSRQVSDLIGQPFVAVVDGKEYECKTGFIKTGENTQVYKIITKEGFEVKATDNHKILTADKYWVELKDLTVGDKITINDHSDRQLYIDINSNDFSKGFSKGCLFVKKFSILESENYSKETTDSIEKGSIDLQAGFLCGCLNNCDTRKVNNELSMSLKFLLFGLKIIQRVALRFGIYSKIYTEQYKYDLEKSKLVIKNSSLNLFLNITNQGNKEIRRFYGSNYTATIINISAVEQCDVYDCTVDDVHAFDANGIYVHNCVEISLYGYDKNGNSGIQMCNLSEINMSSVNTETDFYTRCKAASILGTFQAAYTDFGYLGKITQDIVEREALIGVSMTGMMENPLIAFNPEILEKGSTIVKNINEELAKIIGINKASRTTCIKPAGSTSCILGSSSGIHPCHADRYFRRVQSNNLEETLKFFKKYNPQAVETSVWSSGKTDDVITFLCKSKPGALTKVDVSAIDLLEKVKLVQKYWVTTGRNLDLCVQPWLNHNVSNTITIKDNEWELAAKFIYDNRHFFAGISMLGDSGDMTYHQAPFQAVYTHEMIAKMYGAGSVFASGLIVHANDSFNNNLYSACATLLGYGENLKMPDLNEDSKVSLVDSDKIYKKIRWIAQAKKFSKRHFNSDDLKMTYCLKAVDAWKTWCDLKRTYKPVPWEEFIEEDDNTKPTEYVACSGNSCEIIKF
jgi:intein/homing endonuclease